MTLIVMINADFSWTIRGYHNPLRSIVFGGGCGLPSFLDVALIAEPH